MNRTEELRIQEEWLKNNKITKIPAVAFNSKIYTKPRRTKPSTKGRFK